MAWKRSPAAVAARLQRVKRKIVRQTSGVTGEIARNLDNALRKRLKPAKRVSKQDSPNGREFPLKSGSSLSEVDWRTESDSLKILAAVDAHYTGARGSAVSGALRSLGREKELFRGSLLIVRGPRKLRARDRFLRGYNVDRLNVRGRLAIWAARTSKGKQELRHVVLLDKALLDRLIMSPTLKRSRDAILKRWRKGVKEGFV